MPDGSKKKQERAGTKAVSQYEADAQAINEKTARLRALRLAHEAANQTTGAVAGTAGKRAAGKKKSGKSGAKVLPLSEWLAARQSEGRRN